MAPKCVLLVGLGSDQSGSDTRVEANLLVDGTGIRLERTSMAVDVAASGICRNQVSQA